INIPFCCDLAGLTLQNQYVQYLQTYALQPEYMQIFSNEPNFVSFRMNKGDKPIVVIVPSDFFSLSLFFFLSLARRPEHDYR
ncbi:MAG: hypothetical protein VXW06_04325, partial [Pseudomonadota bacterium]|nr:hypothetical protein [Pseudomonadota bacterium]MEC7246140.1 hypothetical protein [Pseudomonadota bacterium]